MKTWIAGVLLIVSLSPAMGNPLVEPSLRTWTSRTGNAIEAVYVSRHDGVVVLKTADGNLVQVGFGVLCDADQSYITNELGAKSPATEEAGGVVSAKDATCLPVLADGTWSMPAEQILRRTGGEATVERQAHTLYEGSAYTAYLDHEAYLYILPKAEAGGSDLAFNGPIQVSFGNRVFDPAQKKHRSRKIVNFIDPPAPARNPTNVSLRALLEYDAVWSLELSFDAKSVTVSSRVTDPPDLVPGTQADVGIRIPVSHVVRDDGDWARLPEAARDCSLSIRGEKTTETYKDYAKSMNLGAGITRAVIKNHWHGRTITVDVVKQAGRREQAQIKSYTGKTLRDGYSINSGNNATALFNKQEDKPIAPAILRITVD